MEGELKVESVVPVSETQDKTEELKVESVTPLAVESVTPVAEATPAESASPLRRVADVGVSLLKGAVGLPEAYVGLGDLVSGGRVGKAVESIGVRFKDAQDILEDWYSPQQKEVNKKLAETKGFIPTIVTAVKNPSTILHTSIESLPSMIGAGGFGRGIIKGGAKLIPKVVAKRGAAVAAGAAGEGAMSAGQTAEQTRQGSETGLITGKQAGIAAGSGALTGLISVLGGKLAKRLNITDFDTLLAGGSIHAAVDDVTKASKMKVLKAAIGSVINEGLIEELPQTTQEAIANNVANGKPPFEGVAEQAAMGFLSGSATGGAVGYYGHRMARREAGITEPVSDTFKEVEKTKTEVPISAPTAPTTTEDKLVQEGPLSNVDNTLPDVKGMKPRSIKKQVSAIIKEVEDAEALRKSQEGTTEEGKVGEAGENVSSKNLQLIKEERSQGDKGKSTPQLTNEDLAASGVTQDNYKETLLKDVSEVTEAQYVAAKQIQYYAEHGSVVPIELAREWYRSAVNEKAGVTQIGQEKLEPELESARQELAIKNKERQIVGDLPKSGILPALGTKDGRVFIGKKGETHGTMSSRLVEDEKKLNWSDFGNEDKQTNLFVDSKGNVMDRTEAVKAAPKNIKLLEGNVHAKELQTAREQKKAKLTVVPKINETTSLSEKYYSLKDEETPLTKLTSEIESMGKGIQFQVSPEIGRKTLIIGRLYIPKSERGKGIGDKIIQRLNSFADEYGLTLKGQGTGVDNKRNLTEFYTKYGWVDLGSNVVERKPNTPTRDLTISNQLPSSNPVNIKTIAEYYESTGMTPEEAMSFAAIDMDTINDNPESAPKTMEEFKKFAQEMMEEVNIEELDSQVDEEGLPESPDRIARLKEIVAKMKMTEEESKSEVNKILKDKEIKKLEKEQEDKRTARQKKADKVKKNKEEKVVEEKKEKKEKTITRKKLTVADSNLEIQKPSSDVVDLITETLYGSLEEAETALESLGVDKDKYTITSFDGGYAVEEVETGGKGKKIEHNVNYQSLEVAKAVPRDTSTLLGATNTILADVNIYLHTGEGNIAGIATQLGSLLDAIESDPKRFLKEFKGDLITYNKWVGEVNQLAQYVKDVYKERSTPASTSGTTLSFMGTGQIVDLIKNTPENVQALVELGKRFKEKTFDTFYNKMKSILSDVWDYVRPYMNLIWSAIRSEAGRVIFTHPTKGNKLERIEGTDRYRLGKNTYPAISKTGIPIAQDAEGSDYANYNSGIWKAGNMWGNTIDRAIASTGRHPAQFPSDIPALAIKVLSRPGETVLDPFSGTGRTTLVANSMNRNGVGFEISEPYIEIFDKAKKKLNLTDSSMKIINDSSENIDEYIDDKSVHLVFTSPPYFGDIIKYESETLGTADQLSKYIDILKGIFSAVKPKVVPGRNVVVNIMDIRKEGKYIRVVDKFCDMMEGLGYELSQIHIWDKSSEVKRSAAGYPYKASQTMNYEHILVFEVPQEPKISKRVRNVSSTTMDFMGMQKSYELTRDTINTITRKYTEWKQKRAFDKRRTISKRVDDENLVSMTYSEPKDVMGFTKVFMTGGMFQNENLSEEAHNLGIDIQAADLYYHYETSAEAVDIDAMAEGLSKQQIIDITELGYHIQDYRRNMTNFLKEKGEKKQSTIDAIIRANVEEYLGQQDIVVAEGYRQVRQAYDAWRARYKEFLTKQLNLKMDEKYRKAAEDLKANTNLGMQEALKKALLDNNITTKHEGDVFSTYIDSINEINNWGEEDYLTHMMLGNLIVSEMVPVIDKKTGEPKIDKKTGDVVMKKKLLTKAINALDAVEKASAIAVDRYANNKTIGEVIIEHGFAYTGDVPTYLSKRQYKMMKSKLNKAIHAAVKSINTKEVLASQITKRFKSVVGIKPALVFAPPTIDSEHVLPGENDAFTAMKAYSRIMWKKVAFDPVIDSLRDADPQQVPANVREHLNNMIDAAKGKYWLGDKLLDDFLSHLGLETNMAYSRFIVNPMVKSVVVAKLGYRMLASVLNGIDGTARIGLQFREHYINEGRKFLATPEGRRLVEKNGWSLGARVEDVGGHLKMKQSIFSPLGLFTLPELPVRELNFATAYLYYRDQRISELIRQKKDINSKKVMEEAEDFARREAMCSVWKLQGSNTLASKPEVMRSPTGRLFGVFMPFFVRNIEFLYANRDSYGFWARYIGYTMTMAGPRGFIAMMKSLPLIELIMLAKGADNWLDKLEAWMIANIPISGGAASLAGMDIVGPATAQFPSSSSTLDTILKVWKYCISQFGKPDFRYQTKEGIKQTVIFAKNWWDVIDSVVDKDGFVLDAEGNQKYSITSAWDQSMMVMGVTPESKTLQNLTHRIAYRQKQIQTEQAKSIVSEFRNTIQSMFRKGVSIDTASDKAAEVALNAVVKYHVTPETLSQVAEDARVTRDIKDLFRASVIDKMEIYNLEKQANPNFPGPQQ